MSFQARRVTISQVAAAVLVAFAAFPADAQTRGGGTNGLPPRDEWQRVPEILAALGIKEGQRIADVAAGTGYLTKSLSRRVGTSGRVFAEEIGDQERRALRELAERDTLTNVEIIAGTETDPRLPENLDGAVVLNSYHEFTDYKAMLQGIKRALRPGGLLVLVDNAAGRGWFTERADQASHHAIDPKYVEAELREAGFEIADRRDDFIVQPIQQWLIVAHRPAR